MNEAKIFDLSNILKNCPKGTEFWCDMVGQVKFDKIHINEDIRETTIVLLDRNNKTLLLEKTGNFNPRFPECCVLWPSKDCRDWSKFSAPWYKKDKKEKFDPKTLKPFDRVIVRKAYVLHWSCDLFSFNYIDFNGDNKSVCIGDNYSYCIPYNDKTKHLVGTTDNAPEYYRYWEN